MRARGGAPRNASDFVMAKRTRRGRRGGRLPRRAGQDLRDQLPAIVSTGLNAPCSTL
ncbi:hypothetical protein GEM_5888 [Burkholderia cepacia GG4]|uniref:Uncharacterized protein n=1 Tax=Burkholderia cepacia GG4 TaxID=1009846 RepID=A0A9W3K796_BURCE|nr:hypothetical protein GEM_5888 [Burkholderia cepacia GG4]